MTYLLEGIWKEAGLAYFKVKFQLLTRRTDENHRKCNSFYWVCWPRIESV